jgi:hypothetical protein
MGPRKLTTGDGYFVSTRREVKRPRRQRRKTASCGPNELCEWGVTYPVLEVGRS